eukprot:766640-Hanusia_phi.AAC.7
MTERTLEFPNGLRYDGKVNKQGLPHGTGKVIYPDGSSYMGEWKDGMRHGQGSLHVSGDEQYEGDWVENKKEGRGTYKFPNGDVFDGIREEDVRIAVVKIQHQDIRRLLGQRSEIRSRKDVALRRKQI